MIAEIMTDKKFQTIIKDLFIRCRKLNVSLVFNSTHYLIMKISNRKDLQEIDHSADIDHKDFLKIYRTCTKGQYSFLTIVVHNPTMKFRKNFSDSPL